MLNFFLRIVLRLAIQVLDVFLFLKTCIHEKNLSFSFLSKKDINVLRSQYPATSQEAKRAIESLSGFRGQAYKAAVACLKGEHMIASYSFNQNKDTTERAELFAQLSDLSFWSTVSTESLSGEIVPGTLFANPVFKTLHRLEWIEASKLHWVPNMCYYSLTTEGKTNMASLVAWWSTLSMFQRLKLLVLE